MFLRKPPPSPLAQFPPQSPDDIAREAMAKRNAKPAPQQAADWRRYAPLGFCILLIAAVALLSAAARAQSVSGEAQRVFARLDSSQEFLQRLHARDQPDQIVFMAQAEHRIDQIVTCAFFPQRHFQAIGQEFQNLGDGRFVGFGEAFHGAFVVLLLDVLVPARRREQIVG